MTVQEETTQAVVLTERAAGKVKNLLEQEGRDDLALRVAVQPGGCSGLRYQLFFDERSLDGDQVTDFGGVNVVVDRMSCPTSAVRRSTSSTPSKSRASRSTTQTRRAPAPAGILPSDPTHRRRPGGAVCAYRRPGNT